MYLKKNLRIDADEFFTKELGEQVVKNRNMVMKKFKARHNQ